MLDASTCVFLPQKHSISQSDNTMMKENKVNSILTILLEYCWHTMSMVVWLVLHPNRQSRGWALSASRYAGKQKVSERISNQGTQELSYCYSLF